MEKEVIAIIVLFAGFMIVAGLIIWSVVTTEPRRNIKN